MYRSAFLIFFVILTISGFLPESITCAADSHSVAHWLFNEGTGSVLHDISGNGHHGTIFGAEWTDSGLYFDGIDDYIAVIDNPAFELDGDWTIEYKVLFSYQNTAPQNIVFSRTIDGAADYAAGSAYVNGGYGHSETYFQSTPSDTFLFRSREYFFIRPYHVAIVKSGDWLYHFHNSQLLSRQRVTGVPMSGNGQIRIGAWACGESDSCANRYFFRERLLELHVSNVARYVPPLVPVNGLVAKWSFEEGSGNTVIDGSGNGNNGTITRAFRTDGILGSSLTFLDSSYVEIGRQPQLNIDSALTIITWIRPYNLRYRRTILDRNFVSRGYLIGIYDSKLTVSAGTRTLTYDSLCLDKWHQVALTCDGRSVSLSVNGKTVASDTDSGLIGFSDSTLCIGKQSPNKWYREYFQGSVDEISIYDIALSPDSILSLYNSVLSAADPDTSAPVVIINRDEFKSILQGRTYYEFGAQAWDGNDGDISDSVKISSPLNIMVPGDYEIIYTARNSIGKTGSAVRIITVTPDTLSPVITLKGDSVVQLALSGKFTEPGYSAVDYPNHQNITDSVKITSDLDSSKAGTYTITYAVTDPAGLSTSVTRKVHVSVLPLREEIRVNQIGYYSSQSKIAVVAECEADSFEIVLNGTDSVLYVGTLSEPVSNNASKEVVRLADFSSLRANGECVIRIRGFGHSWPFEISGSVYYRPIHAAMKTFYYQRCSVPVTAKSGGVYARTAGHPDTACPVYGNESRIKSVPGGWYDAGDYGKYIVNGGITLATLMSLYELYPEYFGDDVLNIPESGNGKSDLLDEIKFELDWFKTMQDTSGGVFFKVGPIDTFPPFIMPSEDHGRRFVIGMSTGSALNFAAVMAQAGRVYKKYDPEYASDCILRAEKAWKWAEANPAIESPDVGGGTGLYQDGKYDYEFLWAASELFISTSKDTFHNFIDPMVRQHLLWGPATWREPGNLPLHSLAIAHEKLNLPVTERARAEVIRFADQTMEYINSSPYRTPLREYNWGSNSFACNYAIGLGYAYYLTKDSTYLEGMISTLDYVCGKNPTRYSFITGFGNKTPMNPHHRISSADKVVAPVPGFLVGGPNGAREDSFKGVVYPRTEPALSYVDLQASYSSNEVAINWTAPFILAAGFIEGECATDRPTLNRFDPTRKTMGKQILQVISSSSKIQVHLNLTESEVISWQLLDILGRIVDRAGPSRLSPGTHRIILSSKDIPDGLYLLKFTVGEKQILRKVQVLIR